MDYKPNLLSFCIPTYNRATILNESLSDLVAIISKYSFEIIVSDNASSDNTEDVVAAQKKKYSGIRYIKNNQNLGPDKNIEICLKESSSKYSWLLGDCYHIVKEELCNVLSIIGKEEYDAILLNVNDRVTDIESKEYQDKAEMLKDIGWHINLLSSAIYKKELISNANFCRYYDSYFIQEGILFDTGSYYKNKYYWYKKNCVYPTVMKKSSTWFSRAFYIFGRAWTQFVLSLPPEIPLEAKWKCVYMHGQKSRLFSLRSLLGLRRKKYINIMAFIDNRKYIHCSFVNKIAIVFVCLMPTKILSLLKMMQTDKSLHQTVERKHANN